MSMKSLFFTPHRLPLFKEYFELLKAIFGGPKFRKIDSLNNIKSPVEFDCSSYFLHGFSMSPGDHEATP